MNKWKKYFVVGLMQISQVGFVMAQEDENSGGSSFYFGINAGSIMANKYTAPYYSGYSDFSIKDLIGIQTIYNQIYNKIQKDFVLSEYPSNERYRWGLDLGLHLGYYLDESTALFSNINVQRIKTQEVFTISATDPANPFGDPIIFPESVIGEERRMQIDLGVHIDYGDRYKAGGYLELFGSFNAVKAQKNDVIIEGLRYSLLRQSTIYNRYDVGGIGWGAGIGTGVRMKFNDKFSFDVGANASFQRINLWEEYRPIKLKLNPQVYVRILWL